ncbi:hypothetical protein BC629DRAFT_1458901 [Irpex lacteus]|nr:hypothetical protein BC629DRAFT_1485839 [Irpex lacteus]KAI0821163.1 hypothetical protein BC629DRAFT_1458901 [Irpex lacteus]
MPDERTASKFTWLNSPLRGNQNAQTLIDMIQVGQWFAWKLKAGPTPRTEKHRPTVKFRNISADLLEAVRREPANDNSESEDEGKEIEPPYPIPSHTASSLALRDKSVLPCSARSSFGNSPLFPAVHCSADRTTPTL